MKIERSKAWWLSRIEREGDGPIEVGSLAAPTVPGGVGDSGLDPFPDDARVRALVPLRLVLVAFKDGDRWAGEVHGYTTDVTTGKPTRIRTRGWFAEEPTAEDLHGLATTWFDHELREQLGMDPHAPTVPVVVASSPHMSGDSKNYAENRPATPEATRADCAKCGKWTEHPAYCPVCGINYCGRCTDEWQCPKCGACVREGVAP